MTIRHAAFGLVLAYTLLFQFRLWDDLADLPQDRKLHPNRFLSTVSEPWPLYATGMALFVLNLTLIAWTTAWQHLAAFVLLNSTFALWYRLRATLTLSPLASAHVSLTKYPAFVYLLSVASPGSDSMPLFLSLTLTYLCFAIYEILHDPRLRSIAARYILAAEMTALGLVTVLMAITPFAHDGVPGLQRWVLVAIGAGMLVLLFQHYSARLGPTSWNYGIFVIGFANMLTLSPGLSP